jgi:hypothetical protein
VRCSLLRLARNVPRSRLEECYGRPKILASLGKIVHARLRRDGARLIVSQPMVRIEIVVYIVLLCDAFVGNIIKLYKKLFSSFSINPMPIKMDCSLCG